MTTIPSAPRRGIQRTLHDTVVEFESSARWPDNPEAARKVAGAMMLQMPPGRGRRNVAWRGQDRRLGWIDVGRAGHEALERAVRSTLQMGGPAKETARAGAPGSADVVRVALRAWGYCFWGGERARELLARISDAFRTSTSCHGARRRMSRCGVRSP